MQPVIHEAKPFCYASIYNNLTFMVKELELTLYNELIFTIYRTGEPGSPLYEGSWRMSKDRKVLLLILDHIIEAMKSFEIEIPPAFITACINWIYEYLNS